MRTCYLVTTAVEMIDGNCCRSSDISTVFLGEDEVMPENDTQYNGSETIYYDYFPTREAAEEFYDADTYYVSKY